jgi:uncharacterized protein YndB with AHSA1/START domain
MTVAIEKAQVSLPSEREVRVVRRFNAPRELVYRAHTEPKLVQRWMLGPPGWSMPVCEMDVRVGGKYRWRWRSAEDGKEFGFYGVFRVVDAPGSFVHEENFDPGDVGGAMSTEGPAIVTTLLSEQAGVTTLTTTMLFPSQQARDGAVSTGMTDGMEMSYQSLDKLLAKGD